MRIENLYQFIVPLMFLAIWALTSLFSRENQQHEPFSRFHHERFRSTGKRDSSHGRCLFTGEDRLMLGDCEGNRFLIQKSFNSIKNGHE